MGEYLAMTREPIYREMPLKRNSALSEFMLFSVESTFPVESARAK